MAYGLAEGFRKSALSRFGKRGRNSVIVGTFGSHFKLNEAIALISKEGLTYRVEKDHTLIVNLDKKSSIELGEKVRSIIRQCFGYVEPL